MTSGIKHVSISSAFYFHPYVKLIQRNIFFDRFAKATHSHSVESEHICRNTNTRNALCGPHTSPHVSAMFSKMQKRQQNQICSFTLLNLLNFKIKVPQWRLQLNVIISRTVSIFNTRHQFIHLIQT